MLTKNKNIQVQLQLVELEDENFHLLIETEMENGEKIKWIVDTGASKTVFDINLNKLYQNCPEKTSGIQSAGIGEKHIYTLPGLIENIKLGNFKFKKLPVALIDLSHVNKLYRKYAKEDIAGLFGSDFLVKYKAIIDFNSLTITLTI